MRKLLFLIIAFFTIGAFAQGNPIKFDKVIQAEGKNVSVLYPTIRAWVATTFNSAQDVLQMDDAQNGIIICKGVFDYRAPGGVTFRYIDGWVHYTLKIQVRDGRYKVTMSNFTHEASSLEWKSTWSFGLITDRDKYKEKGLQDKRWTKTWPDLKIKCKAYFNDITTSLQAATSNNVVLDTEDDW